MGKKISAKAFLYNDDIFNLPLGKKTAKKELLIENGIMKIFDRFLLANNFIENEDYITALLVDADTAFYTKLMKMMNSKERQNNEKYVDDVNEAFAAINKNLLHLEIETFLNTDKALQDLL